MNLNLSLLHRALCLEEPSPLTIASSTTFLNSQAWLSAGKAHRMRPIISYDDIVPSEPTPALTHAPMNPPSAPPPSKRRKTNQYQQRQGGSGIGRGHQAVQHWDDPGHQEPQMSYDDVPAAATSTSGTNGSRGGIDEEYNEEEEEEESRELTHEEIWDDSALIDAWNSAAAEYEAFHGKGKSWKDEPVKKSPLWYNVPPVTTSKPKASTSITNGASIPTASGAATAADSAPLNFDTFVPTHDPSLAAAAAASTMAAPSTDAVAALGSGAEMANVSQDEAFSRAMQAMYWSGYWTAVYHCRRNETQLNGTARDAVQEQQQEEAVEAEADDEEMLPAQR
ncbi:hypothetical protein BN946_scf185001.g40 [Trametes cinnabarina]|uniref:Survival Motor Neuron Gemin2-binding domain-containing protein n=1 Tax=Pycnoporus cinnabarinus TaxID=5643 RepID=A0A060SK06_PYCCI|nr:hypothetical protein BN946_scf185001.g40 [Trametes cinnabarina]